MEVEEDVHWRYKRTFSGGTRGLPLEVGERLGERLLGELDAYRLMNLMTMFLSCKRYIPVFR